LVKRALEGSEITSVTNFNFGESAEPKTYLEVKNLEAGKYFIVPRTSGIKLSDKQKSDDDLELLA